MIKTPRGLAMEILNRVELTDAYAEPLLDACLSAHYLPNIHDRRLLTHLVYGVLRMRGHLDWIIRKYYRGNFTGMNISIKNILRTGLYQLLYTSRIPTFAVVDEAVNLAKILHPAGASQVNAILRNYLRKREYLVYPRLEENPLEYVAVVYSHPHWLVKRWLKIFGVEGTIALCSANNDIPPATLLVNRRKISREQARKELSAENIETKETIFSPDGLVLAGHGSSLRETASYREGLVLLQDEASQLISHLLAPCPGERILDLCAGTGIKTTHLAEIMQNRGHILAVDNNERKTNTLRELAKRQGIGIVKTRTGDATADLGEALHDKFDRVLVDAPCSGLGTLRRNPEIKWRLQARDIKVFSDLQKKMLSCAAAYVKRGGTIGYSVCTVMPEENEVVINDFLRRNKDFHLMPAPETINNSMIDKKGFFRTNPALHGTDGFFAAVLIRKPA
jgi:16S rRNA (cytosine967-C5)-methyltransferase